MIAGKMSLRGLNEAIGIMKAVMSHPVTFYFNRNYNIFIPDEIDLQHVLMKLTRKRYSTILRWLKDIGSFPMKTKNIFGNKSFEYIASQQLIIIFEKEHQKSSLNSTAKWSQCFGLLYEKLKMKLNKIPESLVPEFAVANYLFKGIPKLTNDSDDNNPHLISENKKEIICFLRSIPLLDKKRDKIEMVKIILKFHPNIKCNSEDLVFNIEELKPEALNDLINYSKRRYQNMKRNILINQDRDF